MRARDKFHVGQYVQMGKRRSWVLGFKPLWRVRLYPKSAELVLIEGELDPDSPGKRFEPDWWHMDVWEPARDLPTFDEIQRTSDIYMQACRNVMNRCTYADGPIPTHALIQAEFDRLKSDTVPDVRKALA